MTQPSFQFEPMRFIGQFPPDSPDAPSPYMTNLFGSLGFIQAELHWHIADLCRFHQIMYIDLRRQSDYIDNQYEAFKKEFNAVIGKVTNDDEYEIMQLRVSRFQTSIRIKDQEIHRVRRFADEFSVIGLWATFEQYSRRIFAELEAAQSGKDPQSIKMPFNWKGILAQFNTKSIDLKTLNGYTDADECRVLNNKIKHAGYVDNELAQFPYFAPYLNRRLPDVDFEMQRYLNGVFHLLGSLIESGNRQRDSTFPY